MNKMRATMMKTNDYNRVTAELQHSHGQVMMAEGCERRIPQEKLRVVL